MGLEQFAIGLPAPAYRGPANIMRRVRYENQFPKMIARVMALCRLHGHL